MNQLPKDPMVPETKKQLTDLELHKIVESIAQRIGELKAQYPHFECYDPEKVRLRQDLIWYRNNIKTEPNPEYHKELEIRKSKAPVKRPLPPQEITIYPDKDGIEIYIQFTDYMTFRSSQHIWVPELWLGDFAVELKIKGAKTKELSEIRKKVYGIIHEEKEDVERKKFKNGI